jgi:predicted dehydrogenase
MDLCYHHFTNTEDNVFCLMETPNGIAEMHTSWTQWVNIFEVEIFGSGGYLRLSGRDGSYGPPKLCYGIKNADHSRPVEHEIAFTEDQDSWTLDWAEFESEIENGQETGSASAGLRAQRVVAAAYESARLDRWVAVDEAYDPQK